MQYLTDLQKAKIVAFCTDQEMYDAVEKVLLASIYYHGTIQKDDTPEPVINGAYSLVAHALTNPIPDEIIGQQLRAQWAGVNALRNGFKELNSVKTEKVEIIKPTVNVAE